MSNNQKNAWKRDPLAGLRDQAESVPGDSGTSVTRPGNGARSVLDTISGPSKEQRGRTWEKNNRAFSYVVPAPLRSQAVQLRADILSIAQFDQDGNPRTDRTTVDEVARVLMDWALAELRANSELFTPRPNPRSRKGQMTITWEAWAGWDKNAFMLKEPVHRPKKKAKEKQCVLSFRWGPETDLRIKELAGVGTVSASNKNPLKFAIPLGELVVSLLQLAVQGYRARKFKLNIAIKTSARVDGWSRT